MLGLKFKKKKKRSVSLEFRGFLSIIHLGKMRRNQEKRISRTGSRYTRARFNNSTRLMGHEGRGELLVHESDKKELITYPARFPRHSTLSRNIHPRGVDLHGEDRERERKKGGGASAVNCQIFILKGADRSTSNIHRFLPKCPL